MAAGQVGQLIGTADWQIPTKEKSRMVVPDAKWLATAEL